jgi:hypothetical protein
MSTVVKRTVYALKADGTHAETDFGMGPGVLAMDELHYSETFKNLTKSEQTAMSMDINQENDEMIEKLFKVEMEVVES